MANEALLKIINADGDLKRLTTADEDYIAYQAGLHLGEADSGEQASLTMSATNATSIGSFTDTFFNEPVGTHPGTSITSGSTATTVYQKTGIDIDSADNDFIKPAVHELDTGNIRAADNTKFYSIVDRAIKKIFTSNYPGVFRLGSSSPGATYNLYKSNIFTDTRTDGTSVAYNLYRRSTSTPPTTVRPLYPISKDFKKYNDVQIRKTFGEAAKKRIVDTGIGTYQLRSSAEGAPIGGTWVSKGTATDTKNTTSDIAYTRTSTRTSFINYTRNSVNTFTRISTRTSEVTYAGNYIGNYIAGYDATYIGNYEQTGSPYEAGYDGAAFQQDYTRDSTRTLLELYIGNFTGNYEGISTRTSFIDYTRDYLQVYTRTSIAPDDGFIRASEGAFAQFYAGFQANYISNYVGNYGLGVLFQVNFTRDSAVNYGAYTSNYIGNYEGGYIGPGINFTRTSVAIFAVAYGAYTSNYVSNYEGDYASGGYYVGDYTGDYTGNYIAGYVGDYIGLYNRDRSDAFTGDYTGNFIGNYTGNYTGTYVAAYDFHYTGNFIATYETDYIRDAIEDYIGGFVGNYTGNFIGDFAGDYIAGYEGNYVGNFAGETISSSNTNIETYTLYVRTA